AAPWGLTLGEGTPGRFHEGSAKAVIAGHPGSATGSTGGSGSATHPPCPCVQAVAVHCMLGHGRTGTLLACYLCKEQHLAGGDAIREIRRLRPGSIETAEQERAVIRFCQCLRTGEET
ncbi:dual specificity protein phosphatase 23, partial [Cyanistes caeruleus]|uniref:dual specificity protein phosphatase 23 n=1 Tax=Cyanistes caeruleus TaxID=156563 RepID=UPI000CDB2CC8